MIGSSSITRLGREELRNREMALLVESVSILSCRISARFRDIVATIAPNPCQQPAPTQVSVL